MNNYSNIDIPRSSFSGIHPLSEKKKIKERAGRRTILQRLPISK